MDLRLLINFYKYRSGLLWFTLGFLCRTLLNEMNSIIGSSTMINIHQNVFNKLLTKVQNLNEKEFGYRGIYHQGDIVQDAKAVDNGFNKIYQKEEDKIANNLSKKVRILCWIMTQPKTLYSKGKAVKYTWGKRCDILLFMSSIEERSFPAIGLNVTEGRDNLWLKTRAAWQYVYKHYFSQADWFIKADDDTFVIVENLRHFLSSFKTSKGHYFGRHFTPMGGYNSGGAGYVFSKETLLQFINVMKTPKKCPLVSESEDAAVGGCLKNSSIFPGDTRDEEGRETFHPFQPLVHIKPGFSSFSTDHWLYTYNKWKVVLGEECCSKKSIAFHDISPSLMYQMEYFIYQIHAFGIN